MTQSTKKLTMGSLFDGISGFPLASVRCGIEPIWASEIEPFPILVSKIRFPRMEQMGGQMADWNFELRGAQSWIADENRWNYNEVKVHLPNGDYEFKL